MFERIQLFFTEQSAYPPNHYVRYDSIWSNLIPFDQVWSNLIQFDPICSNLFQFQNGSRERNAQVYHLPNFAIGHFMRLWIQSMAICKDDLSYSPFYIFTHQTQVDSTISRKEVPRCSWWWRLNHILSFYLQHVLDWLNAIKMIFHVSMLSTIPTWNCRTIIHLCNWWFAAYLSKYLDMFKALRK